MDLEQVKRRFGILGNTPKLNYALEKAIKAAPTDMTVFIQGESGVGKESFSKIIHHLSLRKHETFIAINCGAIPEGTINSELFGHEKGSFTGASDSRKGYFESANKGTIFLDEIGELPLETQSRLLRVLENGEFIKVGSSKVQKTNVRIISATNKNLLEESINGKFREDLYYRLSTIPISVPPLKERKQDILLLFTKFATDCSDKYGFPLIQLTPEAQLKLVNYPWPGNIRQLKNITEQICVLENKDIIDEHILDNYLPKQSNLPVLFNSSQQGNGSQYSERDIFYKVLFDLKNDMNDLKSVVKELIKNSNNRTELVQNNQNIIRRVLTDRDTGIQSHEFDSDLDADNEIRFQDLAVDNHLDIQAEVEEDLSLEAKEKELIIKALAKNKGKRKDAANDLGISERTLYRKINHYEIEA